MYNMLGDDLEALKRVREVYQGTWDDMKGDEGWDNKDRLKVLNYLVVLDELVAEYQDLVNSTK